MNKKNSMVQIQLQYDYIDSIFIKVTLSFFMCFIYCALFFLFMNIGENTTLGFFIKVLWLFSIPPVSIIIWTFISSKTTLKFIRDPEKRTTTLYIIYLFGLKKESILIHDINILLKTYKNYCMSDYKLVLKGNYHNSFGKNDHIITYGSINKMETYKSEIYSVFNTIRRK